MKELGLAVPESFLVTSNEEVFQVNEELKQRIKRDGEKYRYKHVFILKNIDYDPVHRLDLFQLPANDKDIHEYLEKIKRDGNPITQKHPWSIQRFIDGDMWAACQIQVAGQVCLYTCTHSTASCFNWDHKKND